VKWLKTRVDPWPSQAGQVELKLVDYFSLFYFKNDVILTFL